MDESTRLKRLLDCMDRQIVEIDENFRIVYQNGHKSSDGSQFYPKNQMGQSIEDTLPQPFRSQCITICKLVLADGISRSYCFRQAERMLHTEVKRLNFADSLGLCLITQDIPQTKFPFPNQEQIIGQIQKQDSKKIQKQEALTLASQASKIGLWSWDLRTGVVFWNERMHQLSGQEHPLNPQQWVETLTHPDDRAGMRQIATPLPGHTGPLPDAMSRIVDRDGETRWILLSATIHAGNNGAPELMIGTAFDITEQQRLAEQLRSDQRIRAMAHLTAGVAHNFNNMLMVITPCLEAIVQKTSGELRSEVEDALAASEQASEVVRDLMTFAGQLDRPVSEPTSVAEVVAKTARLCERTLPSSLHLSLSIDTNAIVHLAAGSLEQVLGNVVFNARDAVLEANTDAPEIRLSARDVSLFGEEWVEIVVSDNGPGIPNDLRTKIFEPFVTTKAKKGTGLGLASSQAIVERHGGQMACRKASSGGAEFLILLPSSSSTLESSSPHYPPSPERGHPPQQANDIGESPLNVLVVDDESAIRRVLQRGLSRAGFKVTTVGSTTSLANALEDASDFDFVLLDRTLESIKGSQLIPELRNRLPHALVYYFTGEFVEAKEVQTVDGVVQKPLRLERLVNTIRESTRRRRPPQSSNG